MMRHRTARPAPQRALWVGQRILTKYATPLIEEGQIVDENRWPRIYTVRQITGDLVRIDSSSSDEAGWVAARELIPLDQAYEFYASEIKNDPSNVEAYFRRGLLRGELLPADERQSPDKNEFHTAILDQAILDLTNAIQLRPDRWDLYWARGSVFSHRTFGNWRAIADYTEAISLEPARAALYSWRAGALKQCGHFDEAVADCDEAIRRDPDLGSPGQYTSELRSDALNEKSKREKHLAELDQAIRDGSRDSNTYGWRAYYRWQMKNYGGALSDYIEATRIAPDPARDFRQMKNFGGARLDYIEATRIEPDDARAWNDLASVLAACPDEKLRDGKKAIDAMTKACELTAWSDAAYLESLADLCYEAGDIKSAVKWQTKASEVRERPSPVVFRSPQLPLPLLQLPLPQSDSPFRVMGSK
jgi:tetratricopeptide (TPR) repeat protein